MSISPTQNSLAYMRKRGYKCWIVEHWNAFSKKRIDLFGFIDILCIKKGEVVGLQTTSRSNMSARVKKIVGHENFGIVIESGIRVIVHGWLKVGSRWQCKEVEVKNGTEAQQ